MKRPILVKSIIISVVLGLIPLNLRAQNNNETTTTTVRSRLRIAVPKREFSHQFVMVGRDPTTGNETFTGFAIDVFQAVMATLASPVPYDFVAFDKPDGTMNGTFDDMVQAVFSKDYDGAVGDISILFHRTPYVDFTMPYMESYITMLVPIEPRPTPTTKTSGGLSLIQITEAIVIVTFCVSTIVTIYFALTPLLRRMKPNDGRKANVGSTMPIILLMLSVFVIVVVLNASYIVSKASSRAPERRSSSIKTLDQLMSMGSNVGYTEGSFISNLLLIKGFPKSKLKSLGSEEEMVEMLSKGTSKDGVDAIVANAPHLKLLQSNHCHAFTTVPTTNLQATGFGFAFGKGSNIVDEVSRGILKLVDNGQLGKIQDRTIGSLDTSNDDPLDDDDASLYFPSSHRWMLVTGGILAGVILIISLVSHSLLF